MTRLSILTKRMLAMTTMALACAAPLAKPVHAQTLTTHQQLAPGQSNWSWKASTQMTGKIFINYRRDDAQHAADAAVLALAA